MPDQMGHLQCQHLRLWPESRGFPPDPQGICAKMKGAR